VGSTHATMAEIIQPGTEKNQQGTLSYSNTQVDHRLLWRDPQIGIDCVLTSDKSYTAQDYYYQSMYI